MRPPLLSTHNKMPFHEVDKEKSLTGSPVHRSIMAILRLNQSIFTTSLHKLWEYVHEEMLLHAKTRIFYLEF